MELKHVAVGFFLFAWCGLSSAQIPLQIQPYNFGNPLNDMQQAEAIRLSRAHAAQTAAQTRLIEEQTRALELQNKGQAQDQEQPPAEIDPVMREWLRVAAPRMNLYPDFEAVVFANDVSITVDMIRLMSGSPFAADLAYYFGKNRVEAIAVAQMTLLDAARAVDRIEKRLVASESRKPSQ